MLIYGIDAGNVESAYVIADTEQGLKPIEKGKLNNEVLIKKLIKQSSEHNCEFGVEMVASYGMAVGKTVFDTCVWVGRFQQAIVERNNKMQFIYRKDVKMNLCNTMRANDSNIIQALVDRFAPNVRNKGKGVKDNQGWFYGFSKDIWQSYAVVVTYYDLYVK